MMLGYDFTKAETYCWLALPVAGGRAAARSLWVWVQAVGLAAQFRDESALEMCIKKVKERIAVNGYSVSLLRDVTCHYGITQCYLPPDTSERAPP